MNPKFEISETEDHGVALRINDVELADEFDDYMNEECYVFSNVKFESDCVYYYFGQVSCIEKVSGLVEQFKSK